MALLKSLYRSDLKEPKLTALLKKIKALVAKGKQHFVLDKGSKRYRGIALQTITINENAATGTIVINDGSGAQTYDKADIVGIRRLRTKKWLITIKQSANPAP